MNKHHIGFATAGSLMSIIFFMIVNYLTSPHTIWFIYPTFLLLLWPLSLIFIVTKKVKLFSFVYSILFIIFLITINYLYSPSHPWFLYAAFPVIWWPISLLFGNKAKTLTFAIITSICTIFYYSFLNFLLSPQYPWAIYPAFAVLWWPMSLYYVRKKNYFGLSVTASLLLIIFFISVNIISTPYIIWAVYPIFLVLWWPLSMYYFLYLREDHRAANQSK